MHVDRRTYEPKKSTSKGKLQRDFERDLIDGTARNDGGLGIFTRMKEEMDKGMKFEDAIHWGSLNDFSMQIDKFQPEPEPDIDIKELTTGVLALDASDYLGTELFKDAAALKLTNVKENPNSISEIQEMAPIKEVNFRKPNSVLEESQSVVTKLMAQPTETEQELRYPIRPNKQTTPRGKSNFQGQSTTGMVIDAISDWGGRMAEHAKGEKDFTGMGANLGNQVIEESAAGLVGQILHRDAITTGVVDPEFNPKNNPEVLEHAIEGLSNEQAESLLTNHSSNEHDFVAVSEAMKAQNLRKAEIDEYSKEHPVLSGINFAGNMLGEAVMFAPLNRVIAAGGLAVTSKGTFKSVSAMKATTALVGAEVVEGGIGEAIRTTQMENYEFNPYIFGTAVVLGASVNKLMDDVALKRGVSEILENEDGFIKMSTAQAKRVVKQVASEADSLNASKMVDMLIKRKGEIANTIRKSLKTDHDTLVSMISNSKKTMKAAPKGSDAYKLAKGDMTRGVRELAKLKKSMPKQFKSIADGTHPSFAIALNPQISTKAIAKEFNIAPDVLDNPVKLRDFLGLNGSRIGDEVLVQGEKSYANVLRRQVTELQNNKRLNMNTFMQGVSETMKTSPLDINNSVSNVLEGLADTNSVTSKYIFNKGNLVSSDNPLIAGFYNLIGSDGAGRQGMSQMRAGQTQQKYAKIFGGQLMTNYRTRGDELYTHLINKDQGMDKLKTRAENFLDYESYEKTVNPILEDRLRLGKVDFANKYGEDLEIIRIAEDFASDWNKLNQDINTLLKRKGVEGVDFESSEDFIHASWDFNKARAMDLEDLEDGLFNGMVKKLDDSGIEFEESLIRTQAKKFAFGIRNADITKNLEAQKGYIEFLEKLVKRTDTTEGKATLNTEIRRLQTQKAANEAGDLGNKSMIDLNVNIPNTNETLSSLMESNFLVTQKKYNQRMSARIAAAEHGIKDINQLDEWVNDAVDSEVKKLAASGTRDPDRAVKHIRESMEQDLKSFKHGNMAGRSDLLEQDAHDVVRLANKYNFARLMQRVSIASIAELGGTINEVGLFNASKAYINEFKNVLRGLKKSNPKGYQQELTEALSSITGIGLEDWAFTSRGVSGGERIFKEGAAGGFEKFVDGVGAVTQGTLGGMETFHRRLTMNAIANKLGKHFVGKSDDNFMPLIFGGNKLSTRSMENIGLGSYDPVSKKLVTNAKYEAVKSNYIKHAKLDKEGNLMNLNLKDWNKDAVEDYADAIVMQASHIMVDPDSVTSALWQNTTVGKIGSQYQSFSRNAKTKVFGYHMNNAAIGLERGDYQEVAKLANVMYVSALTGLIAISLNSELGNTGKGEGLGADTAALFDDGVLQAMAVGLSRSSMIGGIDVLTDTVGSSMFGYDPIFTGASFTNRSKNFGNLAATPLGQLVSGGISATTDLTSGDFTGAGKKALKLSPFQRQLGVGQLINFFSQD